MILVRYVNTMLFLFLIFCFLLVDVALFGATFASLVIPYCHNLIFLGMAFHGEWVCFSMLRTWIGMT